jgi:nitrite reductase (NO-forming)/hydroxylamine reductase
MMVSILFLLAGLAACTAAPTTPPAPTQPPLPPVSGETPQALDAPALLQKGGCGACHVIPGVPGAVGVIGPDLSQIGLTAAERVEDAAYTGTAKTALDYLHESIVNPDVFLAPDCNGAPCQKGLMTPALAAQFNEAELNAIVEYLASLKGETPPTGGVEATPVVEVGQAPQLTAEEFEQARQIFFDRCAGCHGVLRNGATGPALTPDKTLPKGTLALASTIFNGTPRGMPDWGKQGVLTAEQAELMAKYIQNEPPAPPEMSMEGADARLLEGAGCPPRPSERAAAHPQLGEFLCRYAAGCRSGGGD